MKDNFDIRVIEMPNGSTVIFSETVIDGEKFYGSVSKQGYIMLNHLKKNEPTPAFLEIPKSQAKLFLSQLTIALARAGYFVRKANWLDRIKSYLK